MSELPPREDERDDERWLLDAAVDGELDAARSVAFARRLESDAALRQRFEAVRELRVAVRGAATYHAAPAALLERLQAALGSPATEGIGAGETRVGEAAPRTPAPTLAAAPLPRKTPAASSAATVSSRFAAARARGWAAWGWLSTGALAGAVAASLAFLVARPGGDAGPEEAIARGMAAQSEAAEAVSAHTRALLVGQTVEVASSDRHTVRPWLAARLNFVPPVVDHAAQGFPLEGARRDVIDGETAVALVYRHGAHVISVFVRPAPETASAPAPSVEPLLEVVRGFNVIELRVPGMSYTLVSDMSRDEMAELARLLRQPPV